jgi:hypothetical protein
MCGSKWLKCPDPDTLVRREIVGNFLKYLEFESRAGSRASVRPEYAGMLKTIEVLLAHSDVRRLVKRGTTKVSGSGHFRCKSHSDFSHRTYSTIQSRHSAPRTISSWNMEPI